MELTEQRAVPPPIVVGLLRLPSGTPNRYVALAAVLADFCARRELNLTRVITEGDLDEITGRPGLYGIVLPSMAHLGAVEGRSARRQQLAEAGLQLLVVRGPHARPMAPGARSEAHHKLAGPRPRAPVGWQARRHASRPSGD
ncbi:hypothetical protein ACFYUY_04485 [Kitasatospora sp. NPDC004745]|uniref:hypothetical protein n=1 Tax=Kitasatospora sp. NPDC004745 TaxID=3364019 RepID=UPI0036C87633